MPSPGEIVEFNRKKQFVYVKPLGSGGTGDTHLFHDETTDMFFAIKKYAPKDEAYIEEYYRRFVDEIKILFTLSHPNIVRIYNYYLYPEYKMGYLQMEYIEGTPINKFEPDGWGKDWETIFSETVTAFRYLEAHSILHRDIRPTNILIDKDENVKVIDFGFGKVLKDKDEECKSVLLNWPVTEMPEEVALYRQYDAQSEIYFVGMLFKYILGDGLDSFQFRDVISKMTQVTKSNRYDSFEKVAFDILQGGLGELNFSSTEKKVYQEFADKLTQHIRAYVNRYQPVNDIKKTIEALATVIRNCSLEQYIQDNSMLIKAFIACSYKYNPTKDISVSSVIAFYKLINSIEPQKQKIVFDNLYNRLSNIDVEEKDVDEDLPF